MIKLSTFLREDREAPRRMDESAPIPEPLSLEEKGKLALRLLSELAQYDPTVAERMRELGINPNAEA